MQSLRTTAPRHPLPSAFRLALAALLACFCAATPAIAGTFDVDSTDDLVDDAPGDGICHAANGHCTLRAATMEANRSPDSAVINVPAGHYVLSIPSDASDADDNGDLKIAMATGMSSIVLSGAGEALTTIDAAGIDRVMHVQPGGNIYVGNLTMTGGVTVGQGGAIWNQGVLICDHVTLAGNRAGSGGAIAVLPFSGYANSTLLRRATVRDNIGSAGGGGIYSLGELTLLNSTIASNQSMLGGGVVSMAKLWIDSSTIEMNSATGSTGLGGGIYATSDATIINSTVAANLAAGDGGGIYFASTYVANLYNVTIAYNVSDSDAADGGTGGGVHVDALSQFNIYNTLLAGNYTGTSPAPDDCKGIVRTHARNLFGDTTNCTIDQISGAWALVNSIDLMGGVVDNGGPTETIALLPGSNAIDGNPAGCVGPDSTPVQYDQRGMPRPTGADCDIGAFEVTDILFRSGFEPEM